MRVPVLCLFGRSLLFVLCLFRRSLLFSVFAQSPDLLSLSSFPHLGLLLLPFLSRIAKLQSERYNPVLIHFTIITGQACTHSHIIDLVFIKYFPFAIINFFPSSKNLSLASDINPIIQEAKNKKRNPNIILLTATVDNDRLGSFIVLTLLHAFIQCIHVQLRGIALDTKELEPKVIMLVVSREIKSQSKTYQSSTLSVVGTGCPGAEPVLQLSGLWPS